MLTAQHLKTHNITVAEYKKIYGPVVSDDYKKLKSQQSSGENNPNYNKKHTQEAKQKISRANQGRPAWNKGVACSETTKNALSKANRGKVAWNKGKSHSVETKQKISAARSKQIVSKESALKAIKTKRSRGHDLAFFRGKKHSRSAKEKISQSAKISNLHKHNEALEETKKRIAEFGLSIIDYDQTNATIRCGQGHTFTITRQYLTKSKFKSSLCNQCYPREQTVSKAEIEIADFLSNNTAVIRNTRQIIPPLELDIYLPEKNIAVEYHGLYWHSEKYKNKFYHRDKMKQCNDKGIKLIQIFEDEWMNHRQIVESRLLSYIGTNQTIAARKCQIEEIDSPTANQFLNATHLQGSGKSQVRLGLFYNQKLVAVMTFQKGDVSKKQKGWELNRYSSRLNTNIIGGAGKLLKHFIRVYQPGSISTFADLRWSNLSGFYTSVGFEFDKITPPNYWYIPQNEIKRIHRYALKKPAGSTLTESELRQQQGYLKIFDCGNARYQWTLK